VFSDGFLIRIHSPAAKFVSESSLTLIDEGDRVTLELAMRQQVAAIGAAGEFTVAIPEFEPTVVEFRSLPTAARMMLGRTRAGAAVPDLVGAAFVFSGKSAADEAEVLRRTEGGRDSNREPFPIPADVYAKIRAERVRPLLALTLWDVATANDASLLAIAHAIAVAFFERCGRRTHD
jgi:hypothetical protein